MSEHEDELARLRRTIDRERRARQKAEDIAEQSTARLYTALTRLEQEHDAIRSLAAAATHDIKNPLASIVGFVQLLQSDRLEGPLRAKAMDHLVTATRYTTDLINGLLEVLGAGVHDEEPVAIDLGDLLAEVEADLVARHPSVIVHQHADGTVLGHPVDTRRLFDNLAENAARYADRDPVEITFDRVPSHGDSLVLRVGDNGQGIAPADRERIFRIFQRGTGQPPGTGSGVGLAVSQRIAQAIQGDLWLAEEPAAAGGAAFMVRLPIAS
ncbi:MAG: sensor histidine kinase [Euzebya sp.]